MRALREFEMDCRESKVDGRAGRSDALLLRTLPSLPVSLTLQELATASSLLLVTGLARLAMAQKLLANHATTRTTTLEPTLTCDGSSYRVVDVRY